MVSILIANEDLHMIKELINGVIGKNKRIKIAKIATSQEETIEILKNGEVDVAILYLNSTRFEAKEIFDAIYKDKYVDSIITINRNFEEAKQVIENKMIFDYIIEGSNKDEMIYKINRIIECKDIDEKRKKIIKELKYIGYNIEHVGTNYLIDTILQLHINKELRLDNLQQDVYPIVSKIYNESVHNIKCNINRATECMYYECDSKRLREYFGFCDDTKPRAKTVVFTVLNKI